MKKTKVLFFLPHLSGGGAERVTINILKQINQEKYEIVLVVLSKNGPAYKLLPKNLEVIELNVNKTLFSILKLRKVIKKIKPDIVFSSIFRGHIALYLSLINMKKKPTVILRSPNSPKLILERNEISPIMKKLLDITYKNADKIIAQTPEMKDEIVKYHFIDSSKIQVFLNPIDKNLIDEKTKNIDNPFDTSYINIVASGRLTKQKGFDILIEAFAGVIIKNDNFRLFIIGEDLGDEKLLKELVEKLELTNFIKFLGFQNNPYKYYYNANLYVLSSRWEGLPNTVLENLYLEKPIIATRCIPFMEHLLINNKNGMLVDTENIEQLSNAILNYEIIKPIPYLNNHDNVNNIFKEYTNV